MSIFFRVTKEVDADSKEGKEEQRKQEQKDKEKEEASASKILSPIGAAPLT